MIDDCCLPDEKHGAKTRSQGFAHQFESNCQSLRKAYTQSKKAVEEQMTRDLFDRTGFESQLTRRSTTNADGSKAPVHDKAYVMNKSAGITNNLYQITKLMSEQVEQSNAALNALVTSSSMVNETQQEFNQMGSHLINSRTLLTKYGRREFTDKLVIALAFLFFLSCVLYVTIKRFF